MNESSIRDYQEDDDTRWHLLQVKYKWQKVSLQTGRDKGMVYNIPCESNEEGHKHT